MPQIGSQAGAITRGQRGASDASARQMRDVRRTTLNVSADVTPLLSMFENMMRETRKVGNVAYEHMEGDELPRLVTLNGSSSSGASPITLTTGHEARVTVGMVLKSHRTGVTVRVTAVDTSAHTISVTRPFGGTSDDNLSSGEELAIIGFADSEGTTPPTALSGEPAALTNYTQTFRRTISASRRAKVADLYGGALWEEDKKKCLSALRVDIESAFLFQKGIKAPPTSATGGLPYWLASNVFSIGGLLDEDTFIGDLQQVLRYSEGGDLVLLAGEKFLLALNRWQRDVLRVSTDDRIYGVKAMTYQFGSDTIKVIKHPLLSGRASAETTGLFPAGQAFLLNLEHLNKVVMKGAEDIIIQDNVQDIGADGVAWACLADVGLEVRKEEAHGWFYGITG
jgi:hypothetical protein